MRTRVALLLLAAVAAVAGTVSAAGSAAGAAGAAGAAAGKGPQLSATVVLAPVGGKPAVTVTLRSPKPLSKRQRVTSVALLIKGKRYPLQKVPAGKVDDAVVGTWRTYKVTKIGANAPVGNEVKVLASGLAFLKRISTQMTDGSAATPTPDPSSQPTPAPGPTPTPGPTVPQPLFTPPASALSGQPAVTAISKYVLDSTFTDCVAGWPNCAGGLEHRYSGWSDGSFYYCRLTLTSGADINSFGNNLTITGANQATDGSWSVSFAILSYGNIVYYRWDATAQGAMSGLYWGPGLNPATQPASEVLSGFTWTAGRKSCAY